MSDQADVSELAQQVIRELDPGTVIDDKVLLSRRQVIALSAGTLSLGGLAGFGAGDASAQSVGGVGSPSERVEVFGSTVDAGSDLVDASGTSHTGELADASDVTSTSTADGFALTVDGDTYQFNK